MTHTSPSKPHFFNALSHSAQLGITFQDEDLESQLYAQRNLPCRVQYVSRHNQPICPNFSSGYFIPHAASAIIRLTSHQPLNDFESMVLPAAFTTTPRRRGYSPLHKVRRNRGEYNPRSHTPLTAACWVQHSWGIWSASPYPSRL
jgi:hypothetical protein